MSFCFQIKQARIIPHSLNMDKNTLDTGLHTTIINLWKTNMNSFWTVFWLQEKKSTFCLPTLFFFPPAEIWHWIVFFLICLWYQQERVPFVLPHGLQARVFQLFRSLSWGTWRKILSCISSWRPGSPFDVAGELLMRCPHISLANLHCFHQHLTQRF